MFRRRGPGRGSGRGMGRMLRHLLRRGGILAPPSPAAPPPDPILEALQAAQHSQALGRFAEAAELYERLAYHAQQANRLGQAARLFLRAAECRIQGEQTSLGFPSMQQAFRLLAAEQDWPALQRLGRRSEAWLRQMGYPAQADALQQELQNLLPQTVPVERNRADASQPPARLPAHCPSCGAALRPGEVEWLDAATAECAYCGSPVAAE